MFATAGCASRQQPNDGVITVDFSSNNQLKTTIKNVIPLETTDDALVGQNYTFQATSKYFIFGDRQKIVVFTKEGKINGIINARGNGPRETPYLDFFYADDSSVLIMAEGKQQLLEFDFSGNFITAHQIDGIHHLFARFNEFYLFDEQASATENGNVLLIVDTVGRCITESIPIIAKGVSYGRDKFQVFNDYSLYLPTMSNTIYKIDKSGASSPAYRFDFGNKWLDGKMCDKIAENSGGDAFALWKYLKTNDKIGFLRFFDTKDWLFLNFERQDRNYNWYYNKSDKNQYISPVSTDGMRTECLNIAGVDKNSFIAVTDAGSYMSSGLPHLTISENDNPVIVIFEVGE
jgi:hypothetical protein